MREAGVNLVSVGIFSWSRLEPEEGTFDFAWLDRVLDLLHEGGIQVDLATATASPPPWLSHQHPEMLPVLADGVRLWPGARQHYCPSSPIYRSAARRLVEAMADHYAKHPSLVMWHVGNEYGCHVPACYCDVSAAAFREWLHARYGSIVKLNEAWGTDFWSQRYGSWDEIVPPRRTPTWPNPSQQLDFLRFSSDALLECYDAEHEVLKKATPNVPVTTNFMVGFKPLDYWKWASHEDLVSLDSYPDPSDPASGMRAAMAGDLMRSLGHGRPWILMEQSSSRVNWREVNLPKAPGQMRLWSFQAVAHGADGVMSFFSGIVDPSDHIRLGGYPVPFREMLGLDVVDFHPLADGEEVRLDFADGKQGRGSIWMDEIHLAGAGALASSIGRPLITSHSFGRGTAYYLGTQPDASATARLLQAAVTAAGIAAVAEVPAGVEAVRRGAARKSFLFLLNHRDAGVDVPIQEAGVNLVDGAQVHPGLMHLPPRGVAVIREGW